MRRPREGHPLAEHEGYEIASRQQNGFGGMVSFELKGGLEDVRLVLRNTHIFALAESLGGVESLIEHPGDHESCIHERRPTC